MDARSVIGSFQLPVAGTGAFILVWALEQLAAIAGTQPAGDGLPTGLAAVFLYVTAWAGFLLAALGLLIPPHDGYGIDFSRSQRLLFGIAAAAALVSVGLPLVAFGWLYATAAGGNGLLAVVAWLAPAALAVSALGGGLAWRGAEAVSAWLAVRGDERERYG